MQDPSFWDDQKQAKHILKRVNILKSIVEKGERLTFITDELETYKSLLEEEDNKALFEEAKGKLKIYQKEVDSIEMQLLLSDDLDDHDAILTIHPGAGGTESQDWAQMLMRMFKRWAEENKFPIDVIDLLPGEEAGIKSVTMQISGAYAYGYLKCEIGIHRLVRISPFNAQGKRQTSFASVFVYPVLDDDVEIEIEASDLRVDTYRSSGKGGQSVNTTDSAVRITHLPTGIVVQCQNERSQIKNRATAMKILKSRLYQHYLEEKKKEKAKQENMKTEIGWGNQIRSYVFHPYQMVKDHRTEHETGNVSAVMDGDISPFIHAYLKYKAENKSSGEKDGN